MRRALARALAAAALAALLASSSAFALRTEFGNVVLSATVNVVPRELPRQGGAAVKLTTVTRVSTKDGAIPPALAKLRFQLDRHGRIDARGVPVCTLQRLRGTTPSLARKRCRGALVGKGIGEARVQLPGQAAIRVRSPVSLFNGPRRGGRPTLIAHAYETVPEPKTLLVPIEVEPIRKGRYGYRIEVELPEIAAGYGSPTVAKATLGRTFKRRGREFGYVTATCVGSRLQVYATASFANGDFFPTTLTSTCRRSG